MPTNRTNLAQSVAQTPDEVLAQCVTAMGQLDAGLNFTWMNPALVQWLGELVVFAGLNGVGRVDVGAMRDRGTDRVEERLRLTPRQKSGLRLRTPFRISVPHPVPATTVARVPLDAAHPFDCCGKEASTRAACDQESQTRGIRPVEDSADGNCRLSPA